MTTLNEAKDAVRSLARKALETVEHPTLTISEKKAQLDSIEADLKHAEAEVKDLEGFEATKKRFAGIEPAGDEPSSEHRENERPAAKSIGAQFVESAGMKALQGAGRKSGSWTSGSVEVGLKTLFAEGTTGSPGTGYAPVSFPQLLPGMVQTLFQPTTFADLVPEGSTDSPLIPYLVESAVTNAAATTAEGALYPESALTLSKVIETIKKITTFLPVTDEMLEDYAQAMSYIDARLMLFVKLQEEVQLLRGDGTGTNLVGFLNRTGLAPSVVHANASPPAGSATGNYLSPTTDNDLDAIYRQITQIRVTSFCEPDNIVVDPAGWQTINLTKSNQGVYYAGGPFVGVGVNPTVWGKPVTVTTSMPANTALVGSFAQNAQKFRKGGLTLEASNSHADFFQRGQTAIRVEERLGLAIYRPGAFGTVTSL